MRESKLMFTRRSPSLFSALLLAGASFGAPEARAAEDEVQIRALVVGISDFQNLTDEQDLRYAEADARLFADTLTEGLGDAVRHQNIHLLVGRDATRAAVLEGLVEVLGAADTNDVVVIYFSTHGVLNNGSGYLVTWDTEPTERLPFTALAMRSVELEIGRTRAQHVLMFTDACHSASAGYTGSKGAPANEINQAIGSMRAATGSFYNMASSLVRQESLEGPEYCGGHGAFTCALTNAMKGKADINKDGMINLAELTIKVPGMVYSKTGGKQLPEVKGSYDQQVVLSVVPEKKKDAPTQRLEPDSEPDSEPESAPEDRAEAEPVVVVAPDPVPAPDDHKRIDPLPSPVRFGPPLSWSRPVGVTLTAAGGASLLSAAVLGGVTWAQRRDYLDADVSEFTDLARLSEISDRGDNINRQATWTYGLLGAGAALGLGGGALLWSARF